MNCALKKFDHMFDDKMIHTSRIGRNGQGVVQDCSEPEPLLKLIFKEHKQNLDCSYSFYWIDQIVAKLEQLNK